MKPLMSGQDEVGRGKGREGKGIGGWWVVKIEKE